MGITAESAVTPTVYGRRKKKGHDLPKLKIISASKAENNKKDSTNFLPLKSAVSRERYCLAPSRSPASAFLKTGPRMKFEQL